MPDRDAERTDPVQAAGDGSDLYDVATWEPRTALDRAAESVYSGLLRGARWGVITLAALIVLSQVALVGFVVTRQPAVGAFILLSVVPAFGLAAYVWYLDVGGQEPLGLLVGTVLLGVLLAGFAAVLNSLLDPLFAGFGVLGTVAFFYLVVGPVEETVKWLAVRLFAFRHREFSAVIDGAVYGAMAGLGFATIENGIYIGQEFLVVAESGGGAAVASLQLAAVRSFAGPGHVIYSAFAGYYLGLAKFNRRDAGPIVVKGLLVAAFIHATYNVLAGQLDAVYGLTGLTRATVPFGALFIGFVVAYDGLFGYLLYRKLSRYRDAYRDLDAERFRGPEPHSEGEPVGVYAPRGASERAATDGNRPGAGTAAGNDDRSEGDGDGDEAGDGDGDGDGRGGEPGNGGDASR